ncbi:zinc-binding alcohol dehydrogenase family protein [Methylovorus menthalis]|uniref:zinc-binding alcohol dehydrogenase family protein n=1 Tax=Methylovorus menthalis TaxID=1002227 RepID=UPI001E36978F|nr:zinc-binding alcohol dehydrogenase family protein [Methylovorus menthalis]MCB4809982.1 zinc-binding alcohol dehydrogenase family protein [Methylovorus menthalis]
MKAIAYQHSLPISQADSLVDVTLADPVAHGRDLLVEVKAIAVNPVDTKIRRGQQPPTGEWNVLGWDAAGVVRAVGPGVSLFKPGDTVWYAGAINRPGSNSELQLVDERIVGPMPATLDFAAAASLPLTSITAWEMLFDRLTIARGAHGYGKSLLVIGAAGGVGSILVQLARRLTGLTVIATASRPESQAWIRNLGAHHVIDHHVPLAPQLAAIGLPAPDYVVSLTYTETYFEQIAEVIAPQGKFGLIDDPATPLDVIKLKRKSVSLHWELMFTRALFATADMQAQHHILTEVASLVDNGVLRTTVAENFGRITAENLRRAHALIESGQARGKIVLEGF